LIYIYYAYISKENHEIILKNNLKNFPQSYQDKIKNYRRWQDAQLSLIGQILLRKAIADVGLSGINMENLRFSKYNKPYFENDQVYFNISHSGEIAICALMDKFEIGIDIERIANIKLEDFKPHMTNNEWNRIISSINTDSFFFDYWTQKEAVIKAHGDGLAIPLKSFEIVDNTAIIEGAKFYLKELKIDEKYKCHIALKGNIDQISLNKIETITIINNN